MRNAELDEAQAGIKTARRNINNLRYADDTILMAENEELKSLLMKVKEGVSCLNQRKSSRVLLQHVSRPDAPTMAREQ